MNTAPFNPAGGPITAAVTCDPQTPGSYSVTLWKADENAIVKRWMGNFVNQDDDAHELPRDNSVHAGRLVELLVTIGMGPTTVGLTITQDNKELASVSQKFRKGQVGATADLFIELEAAP